MEAQNAAPASHVDTLEATQPQDGARFGYSGASGRYGPAVGDLTPYDDFAFGAIHEDEPDPLAPARPFTDLGAVYPFASTGVGLQHDANHARVLPRKPHNANTFLGRLDLVIGDVRNGPGPATFNPLLFMSAPGNDVFWNCQPIGGEPVTVDKAGTVEMLDVNSPIGTEPTRIIPPKEPGAQCYPNAMEWFGHAIAVADVIDFNGGATPDGIDDLIVGGFKINGDAGRVYVLAGHANFMANPHARWVGIDPPSHPPAVSDYNEDLFGFDVAADDLDGDGFAEVVVGRIGNSEMSGAGSGPGRAYIFSGSYINGLVSQIPMGEVGDIFTPPGAPQAGVYEMLVDPTNACGPGGAPTLAYRFGWNVFIFRDVTGDGEPDVAVHDEASDYLCNGAPGHVSITGALHLFTNDAMGNPGSFVDEVSPIKLASFDSGGPSTDGRIGRAAVDIDWIDCSSGSPVERRALLIGQPGLGTFNKVADAKAWLLFSPVTAASQNDFPNGPLIDPTLPPTAVSSSFSAWLVRGKYRNPASFPIGEELVITARDKTFVIASTQFREAGQCYVFVPGSCPEE